MGPTAWHQFVTVVATVVVLVTRDVTWHTSTVCTCKLHVTTICNDVSNVKIPYKNFVINALCSSCYQLYYQRPVYVHILIRKTTRTHCKLQCRNIACPWRQRCDRPDTKVRWCHCRDCDNSLTSRQCPCASRPYPVYWLEKSRCFYADISKPHRLLYEN